MKLITILIVHGIIVNGDAYQASIPFDSPEACAAVITPAFDMWSATSPDLSVLCQRTGAPSTSPRPHARGQK